MWIKSLRTKRTLRWRHNRHDIVSNHQPHDCLLNRLFRCRSKKHQSSVSLAFVRGIHRGPVNAPHKWPVTRKMFPFDDVIMKNKTQTKAQILHIILSWEQYSDVIMSAIASQITSLMIVYSTGCSGPNQRKHQSSASLDFVRGIHRWPMNFPSNVEKSFHLMKPS